MSQLSDQVLVLEIFSDIACPWCFLGEKRFQKAQQNWTGARMEVHWKAFQLQPQLPAEGVAMRAFFEKKFGSAQRMEAVFRQMTELGQQEGIAFRFLDMPKAPNTGLAHAALALISEQAHALPAGLATKAQIAMWSAYFEKALDITEIDTVIDVLDAILPQDRPDSLSKMVFRQRLIAGEGRPQVQADMLEAEKLGVTGVPFFIANRKLALSGAQTPEIFTDFFQQALNS